MLLNIINTEYFSTFDSHGWYTTVYIYGLAKKKRKEKRKKEKEKKRRNKRREKEIEEEMKRPTMTKQDLSSITNP